MNVYVKVVFFMITILFILFVIGYIANGFFGYAFDLSLCWSGVGIISLATFIRMGKYLIDSKYNSKSGVSPE